MDDLVDALASFNGKSVDRLIRIYDRLKSNPTFVEQLLALSESEPLQDGATWLLKRHADLGSDFSTENVSAICRTMTGLKTWPARLHMLQIVDKLSLGEKDIPLVEVFARECLTDTNKFVRAWAYSTLYRISRYRPEIEDEVSVLLEKAMAEEAPSIRARIRQILKHR